MQKVFLSLSLLLIMINCQDNLTNNYDNIHDYRSENYVPDEPNNLKIVSYSDSAVSLKWKDESMNEEGFQIEMRASNPYASAGYTLIGEVGKDVNNFDYRYNFIRGKTYTFRARAYFKNNYSPYSSSVFFYLKP